MYASFAGAGLLTCAAVVLAQNPPAGGTQDQPPRPGQTPPRQQPPRETPGRGAQAGYMATPRYAESLGANIPENSIQLWADKEFNGQQGTLDNVMKSNQAGTLNELPQKFDNDATSLRWNIAPGTLVILFDDASGKGGQLALWGKGQISDLHKVNFNDAASRWAWYDVGGGAEPRSAGGMHMPQGSQALSGSIPEGVQLFDDQNFQNNQQNLMPLTATAGNWTKLPGDKENWLSSLRWNLPEGVIVLFSAKDDGTNDIVIFGEGQYPDLSKINFDNSASRWSWAYIGSNETGNRPHEPRDKEPGGMNPH
jgi:hypothetical protein